jgi:hypothetical protein
MRTFVLKLSHAKVWAVLYIAVCFVFALGLSENTGRKFSVSKKQHVLQPEAIAKDASTTLSSDKEYLKSLNTPLSARDQEKIVEATKVLVHKDLHDVNIENKALIKIQNDKVLSNEETDLYTETPGEVGVSKNSTVSQKKRYFDSFLSKISDYIQHLKMDDALTRDEIGKEDADWEKFLAALNVQKISHKVVAIYVHIAHSFKHEVSQAYNRAEKARAALSKANKTLRDLGGSYCDEKSPAPESLDLSFLDESSIPSIKEIIRETEEHIAEVSKPLNSAKTYAGKAFPQRKEKFEPPNIEELKKRPKAIHKIAIRSEFCIPPLDVSIFDLRELDKEQSETFARSRQFTESVMRVFKMVTKIEILKEGSKNSKQLADLEYGRAQLLITRRKELEDAQNITRKLEKRETRREMKKMPSPQGICSTKCREVLRKRVLILTKQVLTLNHKKPIGERSVGTPPKSCRVSKSARACLADSSCGWCKTSKMCVEGTMDGPIFENGNCNGGTNWLHSDASSREDASADKDDVKVEKYNTEEDRHASWDEARNEALHRKSSDHLHFDINEPERVGKIDDQEDITAGREIPNSVIPNKNTPRDNADIPRYIGADDEYAHNHAHFGRAKFIKGRFNALTKPCAGFEGTPVECEFAMRVATSRGINRKQLEAVQSNTNRGGDSWHDSVRSKNEFRKIGNHVDAMNVTGISYVNSHHFPSEQEDAEGVIKLNSDEELMLPSSRKGGLGGGGEDAVLSVGSKIDARWLGGCLYEPATIEDANPDGSFDIKYDIGKFEQRVTRFMMKPRGMLFGDMCKAAGCPKLQGGGCPSDRPPKKDSESIEEEHEPGYNCANVGQVCQVTKDCCNEFLCDASKTCVDATSEIQNYGLVGASTPTAVNETGDVDPKYFGAGGEDGGDNSTAPDPVDILDGERKKLGLPENGLSKFGKAGMKRMKAMETNGMAQQVAYRMFHDQRYGDNRHRQPKFPNALMMPFMQNLGMQRAKLDPTQKENIPVLKALGELKFKSESSQLQSTARRPPPEGRWQRHSGGGGANNNGGGGANNKGGGGANNNGGGGANNNGGSNDPKPSGSGPKVPPVPQLPKPSPKCGGLLRQFCHRVPMCCWHKPPQHMHKDKQIGECVFTADGKCDLWSRQSNNKDMYFGSKHAFEGGKPVDEFTDPLAGKKADTIQKMKSDILKNSLGALAPGGQPGYIHTNEASISQALQHNDGLDIVHVVHFDIGIPKNETKRKSKPQKEEVRCETPEKTIKCTHNSQCPGMARCQEHLDPRSYPYPKRSRNNPFVPFMICSCGGPPGSSCAKHDECQHGLRCVALYGICMVPRTLGEQCGSHEECKDGMACAPSGECIDSGGTGSSCTVATQRVDCADGLECYNQSCVGMAGAPCEFSTDCSPDYVCSNGIKRPDAVMMAQAAMDARLPAGITLPHQGELQAIDPVQGTFFHDRKPAKDDIYDITSGTSLLQTRSEYTSNVNILYKFMEHPRHKLDECARSPVHAIKTWHFPKELVAMVRFLTNGEIPLLIKFDGSAVFDPRASFSRIQGSCVMIRRRMGNRTEQIDDPRGERDQRMGMMRTLSREYNKWVYQREGTPNMKPYVNNEDRSEGDALGSSVKFSVCVWDSHATKEWRPLKRQKQCCPCVTLPKNGQSSFLESSQSRRPLKVSKRRSSIVRRPPISYNKRVPKDIKAALLSGSSIQDFNMDKKNWIRKISEDATPDVPLEHLLHQYGDNNFLRSTLLELKDTTRSTNPNFDDKHPYLGYAIESRRSECCACPVSTGSSSFEKEREGLQFNDIKGWASKYDKTTLGKPINPSQPRYKLNPCRDQMSLACLARNKKIKDFPVDDLEQWDDFGGKSQAIGGNIESVLGNSTNSINRQYLPSAEENTEE